MTTESGAGLVLIWSEGLPFLAGSRRARLCAERPAISLALYDPEGCEFYALEEHSKANLDEEGTGHLGRSSFRVQESGGVKCLEAHLDVAIPGSAERLTGTLCLRGPALGESVEGRGAAGDEIAGHVWTPRVVFGSAEVELQARARQWRLSGSGYFDGNASTSALTDQGIDAWRWGRVHWPDRALIFYDVVGLPDADRAVERYVFEVREGGPLRAVDVALELEDWRRATYGIRAPRRVRLEGGATRVEVRARALVDDGPFYQRYLVDAVDERGQVGRGVYEIVEARSIDRPWQRPFVRMRTHRVGQDNSAWLPLFSGPRRGRIGRLLSSWFSGISRKAGELEPARSLRGDV